VNRSPRRGTGTRSLLAAALVLGLAACGIAEDDAPRDVPTAQQQQLGILTDRSAGAARGTGRIYLLAPTEVGQAPVLQPVARDAGGAPGALLTALLSGANASEIGRQYRSAVPEGTALRSARLQGGVLVVDLSDQFLQSTGADVVDALAQVVFTASEADGVRSVRVLVEGEARQWPTGNGELQAAPLTVYDYPGRVASAQPSYPAFPTPTQP
jgi:spore germination protein GerM